MTETPLTDFEIVRAMETYGGHFAKALAAACHRADPPNLARIKAAFPELWTEYASLARPRLPPIPMTNDPLASLRERLTDEVIQDIVGSPGRLSDAERDRIREAFLRHAEPWARAQQQLVSDDLIARLQRQPHEPPCLRGSSVPRGECSCWLGRAADFIAASSVVD